MKPKFSETDAAWLRQWRHPDDVRALIVSRLGAVDLYDIHQHASWQVAKEAYVAARLAFHLGIEEIAAVAEAQEHPDFVMRTSEGVREVEITVADLIGRRPALDELYGEDGRIDHRLKHHKHWEEALAAACERKAAKRNYPKGKYDLAVYLNGFWLHPEERVNRGSLQRGAEVAASCFRRILILNDGIRQTHQDGDRRYVVWNEGVMLASPTRRP